LGRVLCGGYIVVLVGLVGLRMKDEKFGSGKVIGEKKEA
jgi:hypothetical protein